LLELGNETPQKVISKLKSEAMRFTGSDVLADDITLVVIKVK